MKKCNCDLPTPIKIKLPRLVSASIVKGVRKSLHVSTEEAIILQACRDSWQWLTISYLYCVCYLNQIIAKSNINTPRSARVVDGVAVCTFLVIFHVIKV